VHSEYERVYTTWGRVAHLMPLGGEGTVLCGNRRYVMPKYWWHGTGSQEEIDLAQRQPLCKNCEQAYVTLAALNYGNGLK